MAASEEHGLTSYDRDIVRRLLTMPRTGRAVEDAAEPCEETLKAVAAGMQDPSKSAA